MARSKLNIRYIKAAAVTVFGGGLVSYLHIVTGKSFSFFNWKSTLNIKDLSSESETTKSNKVNNPQ